MKWFIFSKETTLLDKLLFGLNMLGIIFGIWLIIYPKPYIMLLSVSLCFPFCRLLLYSMKKKYLITEIPTHKVKRYNDITDFIDFTTIALAYRVLMDIKIATDSVVSIGAYVALLFLVLSLLTLLIIGKPAKEILFFTFLNILLYSCASICIVNKIYDRKEITIYKPLIIKKWISGRANKKGTPYVRLSAWKHEPYGYDIAISDKCYKAVNVGDTVLVYGHQGFFNVSWYELEEKLKL